MLDVDYDMYLFGMRAYKICRKKDDETAMETDREMEMETAMTMAMAMEMEMETDRRESIKSCREGSSFQICNPSKFLQMFMVDPEEGALYIHAYVYIHICTCIWIRIDRFTWYNTLVINVN